MFGYIVVNRPELKVRELEQYQKYYCGLCHELNNNHGQSGRFALSYDMTFLGMLLSALYEPELSENKSYCVAHPGPKKAYYLADTLAYAADMNIILMYYKCIDDWDDEKKVDRGIYAAMLEKSMEKLKVKYPDKCKKIAGYLKKNAAAEKAFAGKKISPKALDYLSGLTGKMLGEVFAMKDDEWNDELYAIGFFLGKFVYISDAYSDMEEDRKKGRFNPLFSFDSRPDFEQWVKGLLVLSAAEATRYFEMLPIINDAEILRNVMYAGVWTGYASVYKRRNKNND